MVSKHCLYYCFQSASKYDPEIEAEVIGWFKALLGIDLKPGMRDIEKQLRNGINLVEYV